jgi:hypothetical protein
MRWVLLLAACAAVPPAKVAAPTARAETAQRLPFIEDDYALARAEAQKSQRPIFVEAWAPW